MLKNRRLVHDFQIKNFPCRVPVKPKRVIHSWMFQVKKELVNMHTSLYSLDTHSQYSYFNEGCFKRWELRTHKLREAYCFVVTQVNHCTKFCIPNYTQWPIARIRYTYIPLFRERLWDKVHATTPKGIVGGLESTVFQRNLAGEVINILC